MLESFLSRARENLRAAEVLFELELYNASANRGYYAAFHAAIVAIYSAGITPTIDHKIVRALFSDYFFNKRKILPSKFKDYLRELQNKRSEADYKSGVSKKNC
ncbi:MAG: hypothetical protein HW421_2827 [Ignavibacteria bacterium]|nr:hypothetical protein [Ignavibacteria bacterium]